MLAVAGVTTSVLIAAAGAATVTCAELALPVDDVPVIVALPAAIAVARQAEPASVAVATAALLDAQLAKVGGDVTLPPVIWKLNTALSPTLRLALGGDTVTNSEGATAGGTVTVSPQAPSATNAPRLAAINAFFGEKSCINPPLNEVVEVSVRPGWVYPEQTNF